MRAAFTEDVRDCLDIPACCAASVKLSSFSRQMRRRSFCSGVIVTFSSATASNLASSFATAIDLSGASGNVAFTLDNGVDVGQLKLIYQKTEPAGSHVANITVTNFGSGTSSSNQISQSTQGDAVICIWDGSKWYVLANFESTVTLS